MGITQWNMTKINVLMAQRGMKQKDMAKKLGKSRQLVSYYFMNSPTLPTLLKIAKVLSTKKDPVDWRELIV